MMRSMYSGVSGLKTHQTKMDVIGNNIANVNTVAFKSSSTTFSEIMYQRVTGASGPTVTRGGVNAKQIGLGVNMASTTVNISSPGATQTTGGAFDLAITGDAFFVVNGGNGNLFTKAGAFDIDEAGNLVMKSTGYYVMGWQVDPNTQTIRKDTVSPLQIMKEANLTSPPEATTLATCSGVLDKHDKNVNSDDGYVMNLTFFDALGYSYTAKFAVKSTNTEGEYTVELDDVLNSEGKSIVDELNATQLSDLVSFGTISQQTERTLVKKPDDVHYYPDATDEKQRYAKDVVFPDYTTNHRELKIPNFHYPDGEKGDINGGAGGTVTVQANAGFTKDEMAQFFGVVFNEDARQYEYKNDQGVMTPITTNQQWEDIILKVATANETGISQSQRDSISNFTLVGDLTNLDVSGTVQFTFDQTFAVSQDLATPDATDTNAYRMYVSQNEAYGGVGMEEGTVATFDVASNGDALVTISKAINSNVLKFDVDTGLFVSIANGNAVTLDFNEAFTNRAGAAVSLGNFSDVSIDFTGTKRFENGGVSTMGTDPGGLDGAEGKGKRLGALIGLSASQDGTIWADYDNGNTTLVGQIAVAVFANPAGLEKVGENCYQTTLNSGEFDGIGQDITADGGKMTSGVLEMSNVDLSTEFTEMITTQRGFQANSRIITVSDTLLEELINLKR